MILTGRAVLLVALGLAALALTGLPEYLLAWGVACLAVFLVDWLLTPAPSRLVVQRAPLGSVRLSQQARTRLTVTNPGRRTVRGMLRDAWQPSAGARPNRHALLLPPGESVRLTTRLHPTRRGHRSTDWVTVRLTGPLRLTSRQFSAPVAGVLRVLPEFRSRRHLPSRLARLREMDGRAAVNVRGPGTEFDSLREYVQGDDVRAIDWRATARRQELVVRTWRPERDRRILVVVDTSRLAAARLGGEPRLDAQIEAALLLTALATSAGDRVDLVAVDAQVRARASEHKGPAALSAVAEALGPLDARLVEPDWPLVARLVRGTLSQRGLVVVLTAIEPAALESGLLDVVAALAGTHQVLVAGALDPGATALTRARAEVADLFTAAAAEQAGAERAEVARLLRTGGTRVLECAPEELAPGVADAYLALKAAGRL
ncbi:DUF58 domain-containing protein [Pseudactinotalea sp. HY160]|uniref:DUF58 domain-containing protein n=1 Tax=Pseudactinotalea sp. HY160 TaxID=2654490 RepID=UPI00128D262D|nr:DUF58 domain-containing protein [Pseudactinotalea sp. HY160]MPV48870.1 DUF58 domain-containing protein [Pseudactinotalea sp. HY160]